MGIIPKYSLAEIERRWLVSLVDVGPLDAFPFREIVDLYFHDTRLRLRKSEDSHGNSQYKLGKKYGRSSGLEEPITNLYLSQEEYDAFSKLEGNVVRKRRYRLHEGILDFYHATGLAIFEVEFQSEHQATAYHPPAFAQEEITHNEHYSGAALAACRA